MNILTKQLYHRISPDTYKGLVLESVQRLLAEYLLPMQEQADLNLEVLLIVHANILIIKREMLTSKGDGGKVRTSPEGEEEEVE